MFARKTPVEGRAKLAAAIEGTPYLLGKRCPLASNRVEFTVQGPAEIAGVGNGNPLSLEPFQANSRRRFFGKAMLIVRSRQGETGIVQIKAQSTGLTSHTVQLEINQATQITRLSTELPTAYRQPP